MKPVGKKTLKYKSEYDGNNIQKKIDFKEDPITFAKASQQKKFNLYSKELNGLYFPIQKLFNNLIGIIKEKFNEFIDILKKNSDKLEYISNFIGNLDVDITKCNLAKQYNLTKPIIKKTGDHSYFDAKDLRHILIEQINEEEYYVPNDIALNKGKVNGVMLFGTNAVGKSSLIRSIGIAIIMAQAGLYVRCSKLTYFPYKKIFTRIHGNDNIFKGMSTFVTEMYELSSILVNGDERSLVLGDELCSGTEIISAMDLFLAGLIKLESFNSSYIFATHFHDILKVKSLKKLKRMKCMHMQVKYDPANDALVYDRKLKAGSGDSNYGLVVASSLDMPEDFIALAKDIDNEIRDIHKRTKQKKTKYSKKKLKKQICEIQGCENKAIDIDHMIPQKLCDENGFNDFGHKNHPANLHSLCKECHEIKTKQDFSIITKKTTKGFIKYFEKDLENFIEKPENLQLPT